jgi:acyl-CoA reductase-like NAD-dependent aldehyde dehydrogenase
MTGAELSSYVGGDWRAGGARLDDFNPAHPDEVVAIVSASEAGLAAEAVEAAADAFPGWRATPPPARGDLLRLAADLLESRATEIGRDLAREEGKTAAEATGETVRAAAILRYYAGQTLEPDGDVYPSASAHTFLFARREPLGVVTAITPWNFPIAIPAWKIAPALAYGNTVVWKPAELVPLTAVHLVSALAEAGLPPGVLNLVLGRSADVGETLVTDDGVAAVSFTGSNEVGRLIQRQAIERGKKVQLELGGKNPAIVLADADLDHAAEQVARGAFLSAGQKCTATSSRNCSWSVLSPGRWAIRSIRTRVWAHLPRKPSATACWTTSASPPVRALAFSLEATGHPTAPVTTSGHRCSTTCRRKVASSVRRSSGLSPCFSARIHLTRL